MENSQHCGIDRRDSMECMPRLISPAWDLPGGAGYAPNNMGENTYMSPSPQPWWQAQVSQVAAPLPVLENTHEDQSRGRQRESSGNGSAPKGEGKSIGRSWSEPPPRYHQGKGAGNGSGKGVQGTSKGDAGPKSAPSTGAWQDGYHGPSCFKCTSLGLDFRHHWKLCPNKPGAGPAKADS